MFYVGANGKYPLVCGDNSGHHLYLNVEGRATTDLTFIINELQVIIERVDTSIIIIIIFVMTRRSCTPVRTSSGCLRWSRTCWTPPWTWST